jgi:hypothetical protein
MKHQTMFGIFAIFSVATVISLRADITYSQNPDPFVAQEGTSGNIGFLSLTNDDPNNLVSIFGIRFNPEFFPTGGEADDKAVNLKLIAPTPTVNDLLRIGPNGNANIKFSWDAVDAIHDGDIDSGEWEGLFAVDYFYMAGKNFVALPKVNVSVTDTPEPPPWSLMLIGIALLVMGRSGPTWRSAPRLPS